MSGRKKDKIWDYFIEKAEKGKTGCRAVCKTCKKEMQGLVQRLKNHHKKCKISTSSSCIDNLDIAGPSNAEIDLTTGPAADDGLSSLSTTSSGELTSLIGSKRQSFPSASVSSSSSLFLTDNNSDSLISSKKRKTGVTANLDNFVIQTSAHKKQEIDKQIARAVFATNSSFRCMDNPHVKKAIELLRPGYSPPSGKTISTTLLEQIYEEEKAKCFGGLSGQCINMSIDGWSNVHNEPIICATITNEDGKSFLYETIDTSGNSHTGDYLTEITCNLISFCKSIYNCDVKSFVTDNAANMTLMRKTIKSKLNESGPVLTYGCSAHLLNLLCKDLEIKDIKEHVTQVIKYFRNNHLARAKYKQADGKALVLPSDVRWNSMADCLEIYVSQWEKLLKVCDENKKDIDSAVYQKVSNIGLKRSAEEYLNIIKPIAVALDKLQRKNAFLSDAVEIWKELEMKFEEELELPLSQLHVFEKRYKQALTPYHFVAYILDVTKTKFKLTTIEKDQALSIVKEMYENTGLLPLLIKVEAQMEPFSALMFSEEILRNISALQWWVSQKNIPEVEQLLPILKQFLCAVASSASVERVFSTFGLVHSTLRNKLGVEKAGKLVFLYKYYNENEC